MRYELTNYEWAAIKPMLPNKPRGIPRVNDRRVLNGIFWVLRAGAPWRDLPDWFGPYTTCYNGFVRNIPPGPLSGADQYSKRTKRKELQSFGDHVLIRC
jgi:transposase